MTKKKQIPWIAIDTETQDTNGKKDIQINTIYNKDCLQGMKELPEECIDLIITDPPYGISYVSNYRKEKYENITNDDTLSWLPEFMKESHRVLKKDRQIYVFCSKHNMEEFLSEIQKHFTLKNILVWVKNNTSMGDLEGTYADKTEFVLFASKGKSEIRGFRLSNVLEYNKTGNIHHPTEKNVAMIRTFIQKSSEPGNIVLDPFLGSGTTALAAKQTERAYIGYEISAEYFLTAQKRLQQTTLRGFLDDDT